MEKKRKKKTNRKNNETSALTKEIVFLVVIIFSILAMLSLFDLCGAGGKLLSYLLFGLFGAASYIFPIYLPIACGIYISNPEHAQIKRKVIYSAALYICLCAIFQWVIDSKADGLIAVFQTCSSERIGGGFIGGILTYLLTIVVGRAGSFVVILGLTVLFIMLISRKLIFSAIRDLYEEKNNDDNVVRQRTIQSPTEERQMKVHTFEKKKEPKKKRKKIRKEQGNQQIEEPVKPAIIEKETEIPNISIIRDGAVENENPVYVKELENKFGKEQQEIEKTTEKITKKKVEKEKLRGEIQEIQEEIKKPLSQEESTYTFPSLDLLSRPRAGGKGISDQDLIDTASKLQKTLESFGVKVKMGDVSCGPSVTRYELVPDQGVKVSSITRLADDIKLSLAASDIRIEAPIPGKAAVGIEVPNAKRNMVTLRELLESREFQNAKSNVTFAVGKDIGGKTIVTDIAKMPHMLVAGATGSGKSVCINTLIMSIIYKADPNDVKFIMVDPKMVELTAYADIPHLMIPVVTDPKKASAALNWAVQEMTVRYNKFAELGVRDIKSYNRKVTGLKHNEDKTYEKMCQIVIIVDEFADLMMVAPGEVEDAVCRLAQLARAAGIHLVLATQRPSVNVITGLIKANIPSRIALSVSSAIDSRTIIDGSGAEKLLGNGDMLFAPQDYPKPVRVQGAFVSDEERDSVVAFLKQQQLEPAYNEEVTKHIEANPVGGKSGIAGAAGGAGPERDELFVEVGRFIIEKDKASIGMLQRVFRIGFNRAARIMDQLCEAGVVGPEEGTKPRTILMSMEQFDNYLETEG